MAKDQVEDISEQDELAAIMADEKAPAADDLDKQIAETLKPEPKAKDKKATATEADDDAKAKGSQTVPHGAFHAEREEHKKTKAEAARVKAEADERMARLDERLSILQQALAPAPAETPDPSKDIFGYVKHLEATVKANSERLAKFETDNQTTAKQQADRQKGEQVEKQVWDTYRADAVSFIDGDGTEENPPVPDFPAAYNHLINARAGELRALGYDEATVKQTIRNDEWAIAVNAVQSGQRPAAIVYALAQQRGYTGQEPPAGGGGKPNGSGKGAQQIDRLAKAQGASDTLSKSGGGPGSGRLSLESIDRMDNTEFAALVKKVNSKDPNGFDKLMRKLELGPAN